MRIRSVRTSNRRRSFEVHTALRTLSFPFGKCDPAPTADDPIDRVFVDPELGREGFTYVLRSGREGSVHVEQVLEYNEDPKHMRDLLVYRLTIEARKRMQDSPLSKREVIRRLGTSASQLYRLLDPKNDRKGVDQMLALLHVLDCRVDLVVRGKTA